MRPSPTAFGDVPVDHLPAPHREYVDDVAAELTVWLQPIQSLACGTIAGYEALARFGDCGPPDQVFSTAWSQGWGIALELACAREALQLLEQLPDDRYLAVNLSPTALLAIEDLRTLASDTRVVLELTETQPVVAYPALAEALTELRKTVRVAVDDAGAGGAGLLHILEIEPDLIKLDRQLTRRLPHSKVGQALVRAFIDAIDTVGAALVLEGIETDRELTVAADLGVPYGQGYRIGRPAPADQVLAGA